MIDGDTLDVTVKVWIGQDTRTRVRIRGIDAPEIHARCPAEKAGALAAKARLKELAGKLVTLTAIGQDKYAGRVDATVTAGGRVRHRGDADPGEAGAALRRREERIVVRVSP